MNILYQVIIENQKERTDLLKWKLFLSAMLTSVGLGTQKALPTVHSVDLVLCTIPFIAGYVDLLCSHLSLRVQVIGRFVRIYDFTDDLGKSLKAYEQFVALTRNNARIGSSVTKNVYKLESWAMYSSSIFLCTAILIYGLLVSDDPLLFSGYQAV